MKRYIMEISKQVEVSPDKNEYQKIGEVEVFYPLLEELGFDVKPTGEDKEGFPVYADPRHNFVFDAVLSAVKASARNKLVSKTATLKPGASIASTVEELLEGGNRGETMLIQREFLAAFKAWLPNTKKAERVQQAVLQLAKSPDNIILQTPENKKKFAGYLSDFADTLTEAQLSRFERPITALEDACTGADPLSDM